MPKLQEKLMSDLAALAREVESLRSSGQTIVWTNGCFDILHAGHVTYLDEASALGDVLLVGLNSDASVRAVKGEDRPINSETDRATVLAGLSSVGLIYVFAGEDAMETLEALKPEIYAKGGDYTIDTIHQGERKLVESYGGRIELLSGLEGRSTTDTIRKISG